MISDRHDRRHIAPLLARHFPDAPAMSSDELHHFLNAVTGLAIAPEAENAAAFDEWRKALAGAGYEGVWSTTPQQEAGIKERMEKRAEAARQFRVEQNERMSAELARLSEIGLRPIPAISE